jgi:hypothetical protein
MANSSPGQSAGVIDGQAGEGEGPIPLSRTSADALRLPNFGSKMGIDATGKWPTKGFTRPWPDEILMDPEVDALWPNLGLKPREK